MVWNAVTIAQTLLTQSDQAGDVTTEVVTTGIVEAGYRLAISPRTVEQENHAVLKDVAETGNGVVLVVQRPFLHVFRDVLRQGTIRAEPLQLINGKEKLTLRFDCKPCEMHVMGKIKRAVLQQVPEAPVAFYKTRPHKAP